MLKKLLTMFLILLLAFSQSACQKQEQIDTIPQTNIIRETAKKCNVYRETIKSYLTIPEDYVAPKYNGRLVAGERPDTDTFQTAWPDGYDPYVIWKLPPNKALKNKMEEYKGQDVWFRVLINIEISYGLFNEDNTNTQKDYLSFAKEETLKFLNAVGAYEIKTEMNSSEGNNVQDFEASLTAEMIEILSEKCFHLMLGQYPRNPEHSTVISDSLSIRLDRMTDNDTAEVIAVCAADGENSYAVDQHVTVNTAYNADRFKPFAELANVSYVKYNEIIDKYLLNIIERNNIKEKIVISDELPKVKKTTQYPTEFRMNNTYTGTNLAWFRIGFNAVLTKEEILRLAEDKDIKVLYLAKQNN